MVIRGFDCMRCGGDLSTSTPEGTFMSAYTKDITFYNSSKEKLLVQITGAEPSGFSGTERLFSTAQMKQK